MQCEISINQCEFFHFGVNKFDPGVNPTNRWYEVDILMVRNFRTWCEINMTCDNTHLHGVKTTQNGMKT